jgi:hypothetical protein
MQVPSEREQLTQEPGAEAVGDQAGVGMHPVGLVQPDGRETGLLQERAVPVSGQGPRLESAARGLQAPGRGLTAR